MDIVDFANEFEDKLEEKDIPFFPLDYVHGYLTAICIAPRLIKPSEWLKPLLGEGEDIKNDDDLEFMISHLFKFYNMTNEQVRSRQTFPIIPEVEDEKGVYLEAREWCQGFLFAAKFFYSEEYQQYMDESAEHLIELFFLNYLSEYEDEIDPVIQQIFDKMGENKQDIIELIPDIVLNLYDYFKPLYDQQPVFKNMTRPKTKKIGRNDPCPCGSGKKYKHCCGKGK